MSIHQRHRNDEMCIRCSKEEAHKLGKKSFDLGVTVLTIDNTVLQTTGITKS